jgi:hypothetical protein
MHFPKNPLKAVALLMLGLGLAASVQAQTYVYWFNHVEGDSTTTTVELDVEEVYDSENPVTSSYLAGSYQPTPLGTYGMNYSSRVGSGIDVSYSGGVAWNSGSYAANIGYLSFSTGTDDQVKFVSTGGSGPITATFELVYALSASNQFPISHPDADVELNTTVRIRAKDGGNGGPVLWDFTAYRDLETYFGDGSPYDDETTNGESRLFTSTFTEDQLVTFQLSASTTMYLESADGAVDVYAYLVLRDITDGFALESASGVDYASMIPEPAGAVALAGLVSLAFAALRRPHRAKGRATKA